MKISHWQLPLIAATTVLVATGCFSRRTIIHERSGAPAPSREVVLEVVVVEAPPAAQVEVMGVSPSADHVWIPGHWNRKGDSWTWISGHWESRPNTTSIYVPGHWERRASGYIWREGYWK